MGLHNNMRAESVSRLAIRDVLLARPDDTVREAVARMREAQMGCVYIVDDGRRPLGIFTEHLLNRLLATDPRSLDDPLGQHMLNTQTTVSMDEPIAEVLSAMQAQDKRFVCILDDDGRVIGLTGQKSLMEYIGDHFPGQVMVQRVGCTPFIHEREGA